jgi:hypothetical protein
MIREIVKEMLEMPALYTILDSELDRLWRSEMFAKKPDLDIGQITFDMYGKGSQMDRVRSTLRTRRQSEVGRKKSIVPSSTDSLGDKEEVINDWKSDIPTDSLQWLSKKASNFNNDWDAPGKALIVEGEDDSEDSIHPSLFMKRYVSPMTNSSKDLNLPVYNRKKLNMIEARLTRSPLVQSVTQQPPRFLLANRSSNIGQLIGD